MSLTTKSLRQLRTKSFDKLYGGSPEVYTEMANTALEYARKRAPAEKVLLGDVSDILKGAVEINSAFLDHLEKRKLEVDDWSLRFTDYILEQTYPQPELKPAPPKTKV